MTTDTTRGVLTVSAGTTAPAAPAAVPTPDGPERIKSAEPPADIRQRAGAVGANLLKRFTASTDKRLAARRDALDGGAALGEPAIGRYVAFDLYAFTPIQIDTLPPYQPSKIIAGGEWAVIYAVMFVNPDVDVANGFAVPPTVQLGGRWFRVSMDQVDLTDVTDGPDDFLQDRFTSPAPAYTLLEFWFQAPYPGRRPQLYEANLTGDILDMGQPYAAFASTIIDADTWEIQENIPLRYLVYPK